MIHIFVFFHSAAKENEKKNIKRKKAMDGTLVVTTS